MPVHVSIRMSIHTLHTSLHMSTHMSIPLVYKLVDDQREDLQTSADGNEENNGSKRVYDGSTKTEF